MFHEISGLVCFTIVLFTSCVTSQNNAIKITGVELLDYGLLNNNFKEKVSKANTATGQYNESSGVEFYEKTTHIIAQKGLTFGIKYRLIGEPAGNKVSLTFKIIHPPIKGKTSGHVKVTGTIDSWRSDFYSFDEEYELVEGEWIFQVYHQDNMLLEKSFTVSRQKV